MKLLHELESELQYLKLLDKAEEIYHELGLEAAYSFVKSSYHLLSRVFHPDLNPQNQAKAKEFQQRLNNVRNLMDQISDREFERLLNKGFVHQKSEKKKILVVEDEFGLKETFRDIFMMEGYDVRIAVDGEEGYNAYLEFHPDLLFTDVIMPKMSGLELVKKIRNKDPKIKVMYISGFFGIKSIKRELDEDILKYHYPCLSKPFKISAMLEIVREYLGEPQRLDITV